MKCLVISDTHGEIENIEKAIKIALEKYAVDTLIFLGDECEDIEQIKNNFKNVIWVPGVYCKHYIDKNIPHRKIINFQGIKILISHTLSSHPNDFPDDIKPEKVISQKEVDMVFYGHTHIPNLEEKNGIIFLNPGHLKHEDKKGYKPSFAIADFINREIKIIDLSTEEILQQLNF